jgi:hypothetical protein
MQHKPQPFTHLTALKKLAYAGLLLGVSCTSPTPTNEKAPPKLTLAWEALADTARYSIEYIQLSFDDEPTEETIGEDIVALQDCPKAKKVPLTNQQERLLCQLVTDSTHFSAGECGTFQLDAGFIIHANRQVVGVINVGCGYNQWLFQPENGHSDQRSLNAKGFNKMTALLDALNTATPERGL